MFSIEATQPPFGEINLEELFGRDARVVKRLCESMYTYKVHEPKFVCVPNLKGTRKVSRGGVSKHNAKEIRQAKNFQKEMMRKTAEEEKAVACHHRDRKKLYSIAKRHDLYLKWHGECSTCCPNLFEVYRKGERIAKIQF